MKKLFCVVISLFLLQELTSCTGLDVRFDVATQQIVLKGLPTRNGDDVASDEAVQYLAGALRDHSRPEVISNGVAAILEMRGHAIAPRNELIQSRARLTDEYPSWDEILSCAAASRKGMSDLFVRNEESNSIAKVVQLSSTWETNNCFESVQNGTMRQLNGKGPQVYFLRFNFFNSHCMCFKRYGMRVFGPDGKWVWQELDAVYGRCAVFVGDVNDDGEDDIVIRRRSHDPLTYLLWIRRPVVAAEESRSLKGDDR